MKYRRAASAALLVGLALAVTTALVATSVPTAEAQRRRDRPTTTTTTTTTPPTTTTTPPQVNPADAGFVNMMIPHHFQALVMSQMAPTRSNDQKLIALASQIDVEQGLEIYMMQAWQSWNGLAVTNAEQAYQQMLQDPMMLHHMGMATPQQLAALSAAQGTNFDILFLQLMIRHHGGALDMIENVLTNGSDVILAIWANDMLATQQAQIYWMEDMLADKT